jgi:hypothetical protein
MITVRESAASFSLGNRLVRCGSSDFRQSYDFLYTNDFIRDFSRLVDFQQSKKYEAKTQPGVGDHVMDVTVNFESK